MLKNLPLHLEKILIGTMFVKKILLQPIKLKRFLILIICVCCILRGFAQVNPSLPQTDSSLSATTDITLSPPLLKDNNTVILQWQSLKRKETGFYTIERSTNGINFETVAIRKVLVRNSFYEFEDEQPFTGSNYYRIKYTCADSSTYSLVQSITFKGVFSCKFYPNPVDDMLIIKSEKAVTLFIVDMQGKQRLSKLIAAGIQFVDVSTLEKGYYIITLVQKDENKWITEKLIKN